jgi:hypothetical protein
VGGAAARTTARLTLDAFEQVVFHDWQDIQSLTFSHTRDDFGCAT